MANKSQIIITLRNFAGNLKAKLNEIILYDLSNTIKSNHKGSLQVMIQTCKRHYRCICVYYVRVVALPKVILFLNISAYGCVNINLK